MLNDRAELLEVTQQTAVGPTTSDPNCPAVGVRSAGRMPATGGMEAIAGTMPAVGGRSQDATATVGSRTLSC